MKKKMQQLVARPKEKMIRMLLIPLDSDLFPLYFFFFRLALPEL